MDTKKQKSVYAVLVMLFSSILVFDMPSLYADELEAKKVADSNDLPTVQAAPTVCLTEKIQKDTTWRGEINILERLSVEAGVTLTIEPGTIVRFAKDKGMWVNGSILAVGKKNRPIVFSIIGEGDGDNHWHQVMLEKSDSVFENCIFEHASVGLHSHFSRLSVLNSRFVSNETGMMLKGGPVSISDTLFSNNAFGVVFNLAKGTMISSVITQNEVGIMVRAEEKNGVQVRGSNLYNNSRYNLKMGDFNNGESIDVRNNWWNTEKPLDTIFDERFEPGIGRALVQPLAGEAFAVNGGLP